MPLTSRAKYLILILVCAAAAGAYFLLTRSRGHGDAGATKTVPRDERPPAERFGYKARPTPDVTGPMVKADPNVGIASYKRAVSENRAKPGEVAFRAHSDAFFDMNKDVAKAHAAKQGLSMAEARELTFFGLLAKQTMRWHKVAELLGAPLSNEKQKLAAKVMYSHSEDMKIAVKHLNKTKASTAARNAEIDRIEASYLKEYFAITGMTPALLDRLLAIGAGVSDPGATEPKK